MTRRSVASLLFAAVVSVVRAEQPYQPVYGDELREPWRWRGFAEMNGIEAQCIAEGKDGAIWFGTADGLSRYDGFEWKRTLATEGGVIAGWVATMCVERDGSMDAAGWWGISQFRQGTWTRLVPTVGLRFADVRRMTLAPDGSLWAATSWGALQRSGATWTLYTDAANAERLEKDEHYRFLRIVRWPDALLKRTRQSSLPTNRADLVEVVVDTAQRLWFSTKGGELLRFDALKAPGNVGASPSTGAEEWTLINEEDGLTSGRSPAILPLRDGSVWVVPAASEQVNVWTGETWRKIPVPAPGIAADGAHLLQTRNGTVWVAARYVLFAYEDGNWRVYQAPAVPLPVGLNLLLQSRDGALWVAGPNVDVQRIDYQTDRWSTLRDLNFQWESPSGSEWFLHRSGRVVRHDGDRWTSYGVEDGLIETPVALVGARNGTVWLAGSHAGAAATARFDGQTWTRERHEDLSWGIDSRAVFESSDGSLWFGAAVDSSGPQQHRNGIVQFHDGRWIHHHPPPRPNRPETPEPGALLLPPPHRPEPVEKYHCFGESSDGRIWAGKNVLVFYDGKQWTELFPTDELRAGVIEAMLTTRERQLWIGTRQYGVLRFDGQHWVQFQGKDSLPANSVRSLVQTRDGSIWAATDRGFNRFDGNTWMDDALPEAMTPPYEGGALKAAASGTLWLNRFTVDWNRRGWGKSPAPTPTAEFWTTRHRFEGPPPETIITTEAHRIARPGNLSVLWRGIGPWREPKDVRLQYSYRLDDQPWSPFTTAAGQAFFTLPSGEHHLEVRARDQDFNVDPTPATLDFVVLPPVWRQPWFVALIVGLAALVITQTIRVLLEKRRLQAAHDELEQRVRQRTAELERANRELESFSYSVSHDLRAPLRRIDGFAYALLADYDAKLDDEGREHLRSIRGGAQRMGRLIEAMLALSRVSRGPLRISPVNLSALAHEVTSELVRVDPRPDMTLVIQPDMSAEGDAALLRNVLENLFGNAWKFTAKTPKPRIEFGTETRDGELFYFVRDNGAGFDREQARNLFGAFQRYHDSTEFPGTGVGLATVQRIIHRHGGRIDAESQFGQGATFRFTLRRSDPA